MGWNLFGGLMPPKANHTEEKERRHSGDSGIEGEEESEISGDGSQPEDELQCSSFENDYEIIEVSDLYKIQIAGFSKQKLLEMCNFCKISYGNNDERLDSRYKTKAKLINEGYGIIPFYYKKNGTPAGFVFTKDKEITIAYRGTKDLDDVITDVSAAFTPEILPEGGKMHSGFYNAFYNSLPSLDKVLSDYIKKQGSEIKDFRINCTGHSMGAALATITALYLKKVKSAEHVRVATFGSPRVFDSRGAEIYERLLGENTIRVTNLSDPIPMFPTGSMGFKHVGESLKIKTGNFIINCFGKDFCVIGEYYHKTDTYYSCIQDMKPEDFQPDNNVSRYYYLSCVAAVPYYIITTALTTPYYLFHSAISNTEHRYFEREMEFAGLISHKNGFNAMVGEDLLIMFYIECNINGRGEVPLYINNNGNSMELRQLCGTENMSVRFLSSIGDNLVAGGSLAMRSTCSNSELSQQPQENIVDKRENIMNNEKASIEEAIGNDYRRGKMRKKEANKKVLGYLASPVKEKISKIISKGNDNLNLEEEFKDVLKNGNHNLVLKYVKNQEGSPSKDKVVEFLTQYIENKKNDIQINGKQSTNPHNGSVTEPFVQPAPSKNASSDGSNVPKTEDVTNSKDMPVINGASSKDDCEFESDQSDDEYSSISSGASYASTIKAREGLEDDNNLSTDEHKQPSPPLSSQSSVSSDEHSGTPSNPSSEYVVIPSGSGSSSPIQDIVNEEEPVVITTRQPNDSEHDKTVFKEHQGDAAIQNTQPKTLVVDSKPSNTGVEGDGEKQAPVQPTEPVSKKDDNKKDAQPKPAPKPIPTSPVANGSSGQVGDTKTNGKLPNNPGNGSITATQNTQKSNWPTVATWTFAVAGILAGAAAPAAYFAFSVSLLTTGIIAGVAACCLIVAIVTYCYRPKTLIENDKVEKVDDDMQKSTPCCS